MTHPGGNRKNAGRKPEGRVKCLISLDPVALAKLDSTCKTLRKPRGKIIDGLIIGIHKARL